MKKKRNKFDCKYWKPRGKRTHYCTKDPCDKLRQCYGVCKDFINREYNNEE